MDVSTRIAWWGCLICSNIWSVAGKFEMAVIWLALGLTILIHNAVDKRS